VLARRAAAVQEVSGGRLILGIGAGWNQTEFRAFGVPFDRRASRFEESFEVVRRLLAGERVTFHGEFEQVEDAVLLPRPAVRPPLMVGSTGERVLRATLAHVDGWNIWCEWYGNTPEGFARECDRVSEIARQVGREPTEVYRSATVLVEVDGGERDRPHVADVESVSGSTDMIASRLRDFRAAGLDEAILVVSPITAASVRALGDVVAAAKR
jgi:alkanesulfonate monooxygenase SsuD/methylene tetrahydromethanopterin reductase-like flavin-dependent oxidoreductase (luciferase family)